VWKFSKVSGTGCFLIFRVMLMAGKTKTVYRGLSLLWLSYGRNFPFRRDIQFVYIKLDGRSLKVSDTAVFVIVNLCTVLGAACLSMFIIHARVKFHNMSAVIPGYVVTPILCMSSSPQISCKSLRIFRGAPSAISSSIVRCSGGMWPNNAHCTFR